MRYSLDRRGPWNHFRCFISGESQPTERLGNIQFTVSPRRNTTFAERKATPGQREPYDPGHGDENLLAIIVRESTVKLAFPIIRVAGAEESIHGSVIQHT